MTTIGGNWKDLYKAVSDGDMELIKYHIKNGVDPNYQHPEFLSNPIFEAVRVGSLDALKYLIEVGNGKPHQYESYTGNTVIEVALEECQYEILNYLNTKLIDNPEHQWNPRHVLVTGGNRGIGKAICMELLKRGHVVAFTTRCETTGKQVVQELIQETKNPNVQYIIGDLSSIASCQTLAQDILQQFPKLNIFINNAGIWPTSKIINNDGLEMGFMVNYMAPYILCNALWKQLQQNSSSGELKNNNNYDAPPSRIILINGGIYVKGQVNVNQTPFGHDFHPLRTYANTKQCGVLFLLDFAKQLNNEENNNDKVTISAIHPGVIRTDLGNVGGCLGMLLKVVKYFWKSPSEGALGPVQLALQQRNDNNKDGYKKLNGCYFFMESKLEHHEPIDIVQNVTLQKELRQWTMDYLARSSSR